MPYFEPDKFNPHPQTLLLLKSILILSFHLSFGLISGLSLSDSLITLTTLAQSAYYDALCYTVFSIILFLPLSWDVRFSQGEYRDYSHLGCQVVWYGRWIWVFWRNLLLPSSGYCVTVISLQTVPLFDITFQIAIFWVMTLCSLTERYHCYRETFCLHIQGQSVYGEKSVGYTI
jgi:hypothetical protein